MGGGPAAPVREREEPPGRVTLQLATLRPRRGLSPLLDPARRGGWAFCSAWGRGAGVRGGGSGVQGLGAARAVEALTALCGILYSFIRSADGGSAPDRSEHSSAAHGLSPGSS